MKTSLTICVYSYRLYENWKFLQFASELTDFKRDDYIYARHTWFLIWFSYLASSESSGNQPYHLYRNIASCLPTSHYRANWLHHDVPLPSTFREIYYPEKNIWLKMNESQDSDYIRILVISNRILIDLTRKFWLHFQNSN